MVQRWDAWDGTGKSRSGFSLVELMLVLAVFALLTAIAIPRIDHIRYQLDSSVQTVATAMLMAQRSAVSEEHDVVVSFDVPNRRVSILSDTNNNGLTDIGERVRQVPLEPPLTFGRGGASARPMGSAPVNFTRMIGGLPVVIFHRNGSASSAGGFYITSSRAVADSSYSKDTRALEVIRATGRTEWWRFDGSVWQRGF